MDGGQDTEARRFGFWLRKRMGSGEPCCDVESDRFSGAFERWVSLDGSCSLSVRLIDGREWGQFVWGTPFPDFYRILYIIYICFLISMPRALIHRTHPLSSQGKRGKSTM